MRNKFTIERLRHAASQCMSDDQIQIVDAIISEYETGVRQERVSRGKIVRILNKLLHEKRMKEKPTMIRDTRKPVTLGDIL